MKLKRINIIFLFLLILLGLTNHGYAQKEGNIWYFGEYAGINFNSGKPVALTNSAMFQYDGCASISDKNGNIQFYTNGISVWNRNHQIMPNGTGLKGGYASTQSSVIVPKPLSDSIYYIFTVDDVAGPDGLKYSIVSMKRNGGLGDVIQKNVSLLAPTTEKVTAVRARNDTDIWIISHGWENSIFVAYKIKSSGLITTAVTSNVGSKHAGSLSKASGYLKASANGERLALAIQSTIGVVEMFNFDDSLGLVSNPVTCNSIPDPYGIEFSPDGSKLYVSSKSQGDIYQFFLDAGTPNDVLASLNLVASSAGQIGAMQVSIDAKIYVAREDKYLGVINNPNKYGSSCKYVDNGFYLAGRKSHFGLPTFNQSYFYNPDFTFANFCYGDSTKFTVTQTSLIDSVHWIFGDNNSNNNYSNSFTPAHRFTSAGSFQVGLYLFLQTGKVDTISWNIKINAKPNSSINIVDSTQCLNENRIMFFNKSTIDVGFLKSTWDFGDGVTDTSTSPFYHYNYNDTFSVRLITVSEKGCKDTSYHGVIIFPSPIADFLMEDSAQCFDKNNYEFQNNSYISSGRMDYYWDFGDGSYSYYPDPKHTYTTADTFAVLMIATSEKNCKDTVIKKTYVHIHPSPIAAFSVSDTSLCFDGNNFVFTNNSFLSSGSISYRWTFGDNDSTSFKNPTHKYNKEGNYIVELTAISNYNCKDRKKQKIAVNPMPTASFKIDNPVQCLRNNTATFTSNCSIAYGKIIYGWDFGDGFTSDLVNPTHKYAVPDTFQIQLITTSDANCKDTAASTVIIHTMPLIDFRFNDNTQCLSKNKFICTDESSIANGTIKTYIWDMGDGKSYSTLNASHTYTAEGTYNVKHVAVSEFGCRDSIIKKAFVFPMPDAHFGVSKSAQCLKNNLFFAKDSSTITTGIINSWLWNMGDATTYTSKDAVHTYTAPGTFNIQLNVTSGQGCQDSFLRKVTVHPMPKPDFDINDATQCLVGNNFSFLNKSTILTGGIAAEKWELGDGVTATTTNVTHNYATYNTYTIVLRSTSDKGCIDTIAKNVFVYPMPKALFSINNNAQCLKGNNFSFNNNSSIVSGNITSNYWTLGDGSTSTDKNAVHAYVQDKMFTVKLLITSNEGCKDSLTSKITVYPMPKADFIISNPCLDESTIFSDNSTINPPDNNQSFLWELDDVFLSGNNVSQNIFTEPGVHKVKLIVSSNHGCIDSINKFLKINDHVSEVYLKRVTVEDDNRILIEWTPSLTGSVRSYIIERSDDGTNYDFLAKTKSGELTVYDKSGNASTTSYSYRVKVDDSCDFETPYSNIGKSILLKINSEGDVPILKWTPYVDWANDVDLQEVQIKNSNDVFQNVSTFNNLITEFADNITQELLGEYCYRIVSFEKSTSISSTSNVVCISVPLLVFPPNSFTPNDDGVNDVYEVKGKYIVSFYMNIYNRWGELMFETYDLSKGWDGKYKGQICSPGVYYYHVKVVGTKAQEENISGTILLLR